MNFLLHFFFIIILDFLLFHSQISCKQSKQCLTGYKILTRHTFVNIKTNLTQYKLVYKCLCPNNYYGVLCQDHASINCYLHKINEIQNVNNDQMKEKIQTQVDIGLQCWARDRFSSFKNNFNDHQVELREYLRKYNKDNAFGVREQFGAGYQVVWANTTELFDTQGQFKYLQDNNVTQIDNKTRLNLLIGNNTQLYQTPFKYQQEFLGYGLINGNISFTLKLIDPLKGTTILKNYTQAQVKVKNVDKYLESWSQLKNNQKNIDEIRKNFTDKDNSNINQTIRKIINGEYSLREDKNIKPFIQSNKQIQATNINILPTITVPITLSPETQSSYQSLRIQLGIFEHFQTLVTHEVSYNQLIYNIETKGMGLPQPIGKHLTVTDEGSKSYMKILVVVGIVAMVYLGLSYGCKRYKKWKNRLYSEEKNEESSRKRLVKDVMRKEHKELEPQEDVPRQFNDEQLRTSTHSQASNQPIHDLNSQNPNLLLQQSSKISNF